MSTSQNIHIIYYRKKMLLYLTSGFLNSRNNVPYTQAHMQDIAIKKQTFRAFQTHKTTSLKKSIDVMPRKHQSVCISASA